MNYTIGYKWKDGWVPVDMTGDSLWVLRGMPQLFELVQTEGGYLPLTHIVQPKADYNYINLTRQRAWITYHAFRLENIQYCSFRIGQFYDNSVRAFLNHYNFLAPILAFAGRW